MVSFVKNRQTGRKQALWVEKGGGEDDNEVFWFGC